MRIFSTTTTLLASGPFALFFMACTATTTGDASSSSTGTEADALESAQCSLKGHAAEVDACRATYTACSAAAGADEAACRAALVACLPTAGDHDGGAPPRGPGGPGGKCDGGPPPPPPDGGAPPRGPDGDHGGPGGPGGPGHGHGPRPDPAAVKACHDDLTTCLGGTTDVATCFGTEHTCVHAAFDAAFQAECATLTAKCGASEIPAEACTKITERCSQGVAPAPDAGTQPNCK